MAVRQKRRQGMMTWISCPICREKLAGTKDWEKIPSFPHGNGLEEHIKEVHTVKKINDKEV